MTVAHFMPEIPYTLMGVMDVDSLIVYVNDKQIKSQRRNLQDVGELASFCKHADGIILALTAPQLSGYLAWKPEYVPPEKSMIHQPMHESPRKFEIAVNNPVGFFKYLETQEHPLSILYEVIKNACVDNLQSISFEITRELVPYDTGIPGISY